MIRRDRPLSGPTPHPLVRLYGGLPAPRFEPGARIFGRAPQVDVRAVCEVAPELRRLNSVHPYPAKMLGEIAATLLGKPQHPGRTTFLDPMCGSGTSLLFARALGWAVVGVDTNPLALLISKLKMKAGPRAIAEPSRMLKDFRREFESQRARAFAKKLSAENSRLAYWFWPSCLRDLFRIRYAIASTRMEAFEEDVALLALSRTVRSVSKADPDVVPPTISKRRRSTMPARAPSAWGAFATNLSRIGGVVGQEGLKSLGRVPYKLIQADAQRLPLRAGSIDAVLFSPPYGSAHDYIRSTKLEQFVLQLCTQETLTAQASRTVGRCRSGLRRMEQPTPLGVPGCDRTLRLLSRRNEDCHRHMRLYFLQMRSVFSEVHRVLRDSGSMTVVVGDRTSQHVPVRLGSHLMEIAQHVGFSVAHAPVASRIVTRRFMTKRNVTAGVIDREWLLRFER